MDLLSSYLPSDRRALARGEGLLAHVAGAALFADISGFTPLTESLERTLGPRRGAEELTRLLNRVYDALSAKVDRHGGSVICFAGDTITCWFDEQAMGAFIPHPASSIGDVRRRLRPHAPGCDAPAAIVLPADQRGVARPQGLRCDVGAVEAP